jgi:hypothetical protein
MRRALLLALIVAALAGCADEGGLLFSLHTSHDFSNAPREHGFVITESATLLIVHVGIEPTQGGAACGPDVRITLMREDLMRELVAPPTCRAFEEWMIEDPAGSWVARFDGQALALAGLNVRAERAGGGGGVRVAQG